jgi:rhodanese-related sulfurtransferase
MRWEKAKVVLDIREDSERHYLKVHSPGAKEQNIDNYLNKWDLIEDFKPFYEQIHREDNPNYWVMVVTDKPEQNFTAKQIVTTRMNDKFWGFNARVSHRTLLKMIK